MGVTVSGTEEFPLLSTRDGRRARYVPAVSELMLDRAGRPRSPVTVPRFHTGRVPGNKMGIATRRTRLTPRTDPTGDAEAALGTPRDNSTPLDGQPHRQACSSALSLGCCIEAHAIAP